MPKTQSQNLFLYDQELCQGTALVLCGVDEAGRGPLAGPVCAGAVVLPAGVCPQGLNDSKKLSERRREALYQQITADAFWCAGWATVEEIEQYNILNATFLAVRRAYDGLCKALGRAPGLVLVDGNQRPPIPGAVQTVVGGDAASACIAAASIIAKVSRDRYMKEMDARYPQYQFARHKGYGTKLHCDLLRQYGPCPAHRLSFLGRILEERP